MTQFYVLLLLQILDLVSTVLALRNPKLSEANRPLGWVMKKVGTLPALMILKAVAMVLIYWHRDDIGVYMLGLIAIYGVVIANNTYRIKRGY